MAGFLIALPTTPLYDRMRQEGRLIEGMPINRARSPNFRTVLPLSTVLQGGASILGAICEPSAFYDRAFRSVADWGARPCQKPPSQPRSYKRRALMRSLVRQGILSSYRRAYWTFAFRILRHWRSDPQRGWMALTLLLSGHHFILYAQEVVAEIHEELRQLDAAAPPLAADTTAHAA
jgi:Domain of unknown function (DUF4070)